MESEVELGKGILGYDTVHFTKLKSCSGRNCIYFEPTNPEDPKCLQNNRSAFILFKHGVSSYTVDDVRQNAECIKK